MAVCCCGVFCAEIVEGGEGLVEVGVVGGDEGGDGGVFADDAGEEEAGFVVHGLTERGGHLGEFGGVEGLVCEIGEAEPLGAEAVEEGAGAVVFEHAGDLGLEDGGVVEFALIGEGGELGIGHGGPEEVGEAGGEHPVVEGEDLGRGWGRGWGGG